MPPLRILRTSLVLRLMASTLPWRVVTYTVSPGGIERYCGPSGRGTAPSVCCVRSSKIVSPSVQATQSWLEVLPFILDPAVRATANPYTGPLTPKVFRILQFVGSSAVTCADPLPAAYKVFISGSIASSEGSPGRCAVQNIRPVPVLITDTCPMAGCEA